MAVNLYQKTIEMAVSLSAVNPPFSPVKGENKSTQTEDQTRTVPIAATDHMCPRCFSTSHITRRLSNSSHKNEFITENQQVGSDRFVRVVTCKGGVLVHRRQMISMSGDRKSLILRNVTSFDSFGVYDIILSTFKPEETTKITKPNQILEIRTR